MRLKKLVLNNFRNYRNASVVINSDVICIVGENGAGKTNLIDAIFYMMLTKSSLNNVDRQNIHHDENYFFIKGQVEQKDSNFDILLAFESGKKKVVKVNDSEYDKLSEHVGRFPVVMIAPDDIIILLGGSEERRKFFDGTLSQISQAYLQDLMNYNRYLRQRNEALKAFAESHRPDYTLLELYDDNLLSLGQRIFAYRKEHVQHFIEDFEKNYSQISDDKEAVKIVYQSNFNDPDFNVRDFRKKDLILQRTTWGIHKDDFEFLIDERPVKKFASQGQRKSFLTALKLAQFDYIAQEKKIKPILLLDDIFDKLDDVRIGHLLEMIKQNRFDQTFFTDARSLYTRTLFEDRGIEFQSIAISEGEVVDQ